MNKLLSLISFLLFITLSVSTSYAGSHEKKADNTVATEKATADATKKEMKQTQSEDAESIEAKKDDASEKKEDAKKKEAEEEEEPDCD